MESQQFEDKKFILHKRRDESIIYSDLSANESSQYAWASWDAHVHNSMLVCHLLE